MTKPGLSADRHDEIGKLLVEIQLELTRLTVEVEDAYPLSAKFALAVRRAEEAVREARTEGDRKLADEHPNQWDPNVYFGPGRRAAR